MTMETLIAAFQMAIILLFIHAASWEGMITEYIRIGKWTLQELLQEVPAFISKPLYDCLICMSPWWATGLGLPLFFDGYHFTKDAVTFILLTAGISVIFDTLIVGKRRWN